MSTNIRNGVRGISQHRPRQTETKLSNRQHVCGRQCGRCVLPSDPSWEDAARHIPSTKYGDPFAASSVPWYLA